MKFEDAVKKAVKRYHLEVERISKPKEEIDPLEDRPLFKEYEKTRGKSVRYSPQFFKKMEDKFSGSEDKSSAQETKDKKGLLDES